MIEHMNLKNKKKEKLSYKKKKNNYKEKKSKC